jgi:hypothetical protein
MDVLGVSVESSLKPRCINCVEKYVCSTDELNLNPPPYGIDVVVYKVETNEGVKYMVSKCLNISCFLLLR